MELICNDFLLNNNIHPRHSLPLPDVKLNLSLPQSGLSLDLKLLPMWPQQLS